MEWNDIKDDKPCVGQHVIVKHVNGDVSRGSFDHCGEFFDIGGRNLDVISWIPDPLDRGLGSEDLMLRLNLYPDGEIPQSVIRNALVFLLKRVK